MLTEEELKFASCLRHPDLQRTRPVQEWRYSPPRANPSIGPTTSGKDLQKFVYSHPVFGPGASSIGQAGSGHTALAECELLQGRPGSASQPAAFAGGSGLQGIVPRHPVLGPGASLVGQAGSGRS